MGTAYSALKKIAVGFTKWPEDVAFVSQFILPLITILINILSLSKTNEAARRRRRGVLIIR
jgi:hypothetical protein